jgi:cytochrome P450
VRDYPDEAAAADSTRYGTLGAIISPGGRYVSIYGLRISGAQRTFFQHVDSLMNERESAPTDDLISALVGVRAAEGKVSTDELRNLLVTLVFAAHDNTRHQFGNAMVAFAEHPGQWALLAEHPELAPQAVEETMRWCPSARALFRFAAQDFDYQGMRIAKNTLITMCIVAAQRDPRVFGDGNSFDITLAREAPTLQFGGGPHHCLGAALARAELSEALPVLASRLGPPSLAGPVSWRPPIGIYGPDQLPLRFG